MYILIHKFIVKFTAFHILCRNPVLASISFLSRRSVMCSTHQLSFFARLHMEEETGALWIYITEVQQFVSIWLNSSSHQFEIQMFSFSCPWGDHSHTSTLQSCQHHQHYSLCPGEGNRWKLPQGIAQLQSRSAHYEMFPCWVIIWWMNKLSPMSQLQNNFKWNAQNIVLRTTSQLTPEGQGV